MCHPPRTNKQTISEGMQMEPTEQPQTHCRLTTILTENLCGSYIRTF